MKKLAAAAIATTCATLALGLASCGQSTSATYQNKTVTEVYSQAVSVLDENKWNYETVTHFDVDIVMSGKTMTMDIDSDTKLDGGKYYQSATMASTTTEIWFVDDVLYTKYGDNTYQQSITWADLCNTYGLDSDQPGTKLYEIPETSLSTTAFIYEDGGAYFTVTLSGDDAKKLIEENLNSMSSLISISNVASSDVIYTVHVDENLAPKSVDVKFDVSMTILDYEVTYNYTGNMQFQNIGSTVVTAPSFE